MLSNSSGSIRAMIFFEKRLCDILVMLVTEVTSVRVQLSPLLGGWMDGCALRSVGVNPYLIFCPLTTLVMLVTVVTLVIIENV